MYVSIDISGFAKIVKVSFVEENNPGLGYTKEVGGMMLCP